MRPSVTWSWIPPTRPATTGFVFHIAHPSSPASADIVARTESASASTA